MTMTPWATPCEPGARPREQRALKAQQYKAWGNAPGTQPSNYCRAVSAKEVQAERHELAQMAEAQPAFYKSSRRRYIREQRQYPYYTCEYHIGCGGYPRGFDASLLLRLQRALHAGERYLGRCPRL